MNARELAAKFRLHRNGREWRGTCPACGYGGNAFVLADGKRGPVGWCASCRDSQAIAEALGGGPHNAGALQQREVDARDVQARIARADRLWRGSEPLPGTPGAIYLDMRGIGHLVACADLRFRVDCPHPSGTLELPIRLPALIAAVRDVAARFVGVHRTFLRRDGSGKTEIEPQKASLGNVRGGAVRLALLEEVLAAGELTIGEGVETSASAGLLLGLPSWSAVSAGNLEHQLMVPPQVRSVVIAADPDPPGRRAASAAWHRWTSEGRRVRISTPHGDADFNDVLVRRLALGVGT